LSSCRTDFKKIKFNKELWEKGDWKIRGQMVDNIINDSILIGKDREQVINLLGYDDLKNDDSTPTYFSYIVDIEKNIGPLGFGGKWLFDLNIAFDSITNKVVYVNCRD